MIDDKPGIPMGDQFPPNPQFEDEDDDKRTGDLPNAVRQRLDTLIPEMVKKTVTAGLEAVFATEEGIRRLAKDMSLPKEVAGYLAQTAGSTKDELLRIIAREVREFLETVNLSEELPKILTTLSLEVKTEIRFIPNDEKYSVKPDVKANVRLKKVEERVRRRRRRRRRIRDDDRASDTSLDD